MLPEVIDKVGGHLTLIGLTQVDVTLMDSPTDSRLGDLKISLKFETNHR
jgi:hypothetical protein